MSLKEELRPWIEEAVEAQELKKRITVLETGIRKVLNESLYHFDDNPSTQRMLNEVRFILEELLTP